MKLSPRTNPADLCICKNFKICLDLSSGNGNGHTPPGKVGLLVVLPPSLEKYMDAVSVFYCSRAAGCWGGKEGELKIEKKAKEKARRRKDNNERRNSDCLNIQHNQCGLRYSWLTVFHLLISVSL